MVYILATFVFRTVFVTMRPEEVSTRLLFSQASLERGFEVALSAVWLGTIAIVVGFVLFAHTEKVKSSQNEKPITVSDPALVFAFLIVLVGSVLIIRTAGGVAYAFANIKVIRETLEGERAPLLLVWVGEFIALVAACSWAKLNIVRRLAVLSIIAIGTLTGLAIGSRGSLLPFLACLAIIVALASGKQRDYSGKPSKPLRKVSLLILPVASLMLVFGAFKQNSTPSGGEVSIDFASTVEAEQLAAQFKDADYFALVVGERAQLPSGAELFISAAQFPLMSIPSAIGIEKPRPYDYDLRGAVLGGIVETGLPASIFGELWLIGGIPLVVLGCLLVGAFLRFLGTRLNLGSSSWCVWAAMATGWLYLFLSRPLVISLSRLLTFTFCLILALIIVRLFSRQAEE